ncbi:MAG TPA: hypothetical protein P5526_16100 [Anaerolineae bacterium]|nr:hypothetical protein [Anaerolineae bacterium]MCB9109569.1 hypothetical protein [Anaerolineales bacterium]HRV93684.1 hypothetical protein [Anaerolineae bacterium]
MPAQPTERRISDEPFANGLQARQRKRSRFIRLLSSQRVQRVPPRD